MYLAIFDGQKQFFITISPIIAIISKRIFQMHLLRGLYSCGARYY